MGAEAAVGIIKEHLVGILQETLLNVSRRHYRSRADLRLNVYDLGKREAV